MQFKTFKDNSIIIWFVFLMLSYNGAQSEDMDESCLLECDSQSKINLKRNYCEQCLRMPIRFGRQDSAYNNKLAIIFKTMWKNPDLQHIPHEILDVIKLSRTSHYTPDYIPRYRLKPIPNSEPEYMDISTYK